MKFNLSFNFLFKQLSIFAASSLCLTGIVGLQKAEIKLDNNNLDRKDFLLEENIDRANINALKQLPAFGYNNLIGDLAYLQFLQYFGDGDARNKTGYSLSADYLEAVTKKDPRFVRAYFLLLPASSIFAGEPERSVKQLEIALEYIKPEFHPDSYYLWIYRGMDELLLLNRPDLASKSYEMAIKWARQIDTPRSNKSAQNIAKTVRFITENPNSVTGQIGAWTLILSSSDNKQTQNKAIEKIRNLGGSIFVDSNGNFQVKVPENAT